MLLAASSLTKSYGIWPALVPITRPQLHELYAGALAVWKSVQATVRGDEWLSERAEIQVRRLWQMIKQSGYNVTVATLQAYEEL